MEVKAGLKYDEGKPIAGVLFDEFPSALDGVSHVATHGANKYSRSNWLQVDNALERYKDALVRHQIAKGKGEVYDKDSGLKHSWHIAWNSLAIIELEDRGQK